MEEDHDPGRPSAAAQRKNPLFEEEFPWGIINWNSWKDPILQVQFCQDHVTIIISPLILLNSIGGIMCWE